jgi:predicted ATPase
VASETSEHRIVLETHSEHILLSIRLAILKGQLDRDDVAIHWVSQQDDGRSRIQRAELDENAELTGPWPPSVFGDDTEMAREIWELRRGQHSSGASE